MISSDWSNAYSLFILNPFTEYKEDLKGLILVSKEHSSCPSWVVIHYYKTISLSTHKGCSSWTKQINMYCSSGLEVEMEFLLEKEVLICVLFWHASQSKSSLYDILGKPLTRSCLWNFEINLKLACLSFLCQTQWFPLMDNRHVTFWFDSSLRLIL